MPPARDSRGRFISGSGSAGGGGQIKIELIPKGIVELLQSQPIADDLDRRGQAIEDSAGSADYQHRTWIGFDRAQCTVTPATYKGLIDEAQNKRLTRSIDAARR